MAYHHPRIRYLIYDLDGTLVDSALDFDQMREEIGLPRGAPILESLAAMAPDQSRRGWEIVERHELAGARRAVPFAGVLEFLTALAERGVRQAVLTRNSRAVAEAMLAALPWPFDLVVTRDEGPIKPDPRALWRICEHWGAPCQATAMVGDSRFDMETGRRAGVYNVLYTRQRDLRRLDYAAWAHYLLPSFAPIDDFLAWLCDPHSQPPSPEAIQ